MTLKEFQDIKVRKGKFYKATYQKTINGYTKTTTTTVRFVDYYKTKKAIANGRVPSGKGNPNVQVIIPHVLSYNTNTKNYLVHLQATPNGKTTTIYKDQSGNEITKANYYQATSTKPSAPSDYHNVYLQDLVAIY